MKMETGNREFEDMINFWTVFDSLFLSRTKS